MQLGAGVTHTEVQFVSVATQTDPKTQGLSFYYTAAADRGLLPGMSVLAFLPARPGFEALEIPPSALVWLSGSAWVYLGTGTETFSRHPIPTDAPLPDGGFAVPVGTFPRPRPELVLKGAQVLLSEEFRAQIQVGEDRK